MAKYICIHGHFYQPPRENPWLESVELQESAHPFHDWNERITSECYARNGASRILDQHGYISEIVNNYSKISFNIGPTLLSWMELRDPEAYASILEADRLSQTYFSGHGSAMAQVYNHMIMPLANSRDKRTQIIWGIKDFESRYGRFPEGMWLAETAVDLESLDIMAEQGLKFALLAPHQAKRAKLIKEDRDWEPEDEEQIDLRRPYLCNLPSGRSIALFFYDGPISRAVAFEGLLNDGSALAGRIAGAFEAKAKNDQLVHIATDGESYGHHHQFGDMALAYCLKYIEAEGLAKLTVYGEYLEKHPPEFEVEIVENSSWSCIHGVERWRDDCGCNSGMKQDWDQKWRKPLRGALDFLRDHAIRVFEKEMGAFVKDPWALRDVYIDLVLNRTRENIDNFLAIHVKEGLSEEEKNNVLRCLEVQRNAMLMYTSCGWFFDDISGIETVQIIKYAARVIQLIRRVAGEDLELAFIEHLGAAKSNVPEANNGARVYKMYVEPSIVDIYRVGAHFAISSLYNEYPEHTKLYCFSVHRQAYERQGIGKLELLVGRARIVSEITLTVFDVQFIVLHLGDHNFICGVDRYVDEEGYRKILTESKEIFVQGDIPRTIQVVNRYFGTRNYSLWHLFRHEQQQILDQVFDSTMDELEVSFRQIYDDHFSLIRMINENNLSLPKSLGNVVEFVLRRDLIKLLSMEEIPLEPLSRSIREIVRWQFKRDKEQLDFLAEKRIHDMMLKIEADPENGVGIDKVVQFMRLLGQLDLELDLWRAQNIYYKIGKVYYSQKRTLAGDNEEVRHWLSAFKQLGEILKVKVS